jgi:WD40 repeat protein
MASMGCFSEGELRALVVGDLPEPIARLVTLHLEHCPACEAVAGRLDSVTDPFLVSLRQAVKTSAPSSRATESTLPNVSPAVESLNPTISENGRETGRFQNSFHRPLPGFKVHEEIGRGGMSIVYRAQQSRPERVVALKMLLFGASASTERRLRFLAEADAVARLQHPGIVQIYEVGEHEGLLFLVLEYMDGGSLAQKLAGKPLPAREAAELVEVLAWAVQHAHSHGVIHRDLKPANILLAARRGPDVESRLLASYPKISDFGLAKQERSNLTANGDMLGTPSYMAPEQATGAVKEVGPAADIYGLGGILYELLTGRPPFVAESVLETLQQVRTRDPLPPRRLTPSIPRDLETICLTCLEKEPGQRYSSAGALADDLRRFLNGHPVHARPVGAWGRAWRWAGRNPARAAMIASIVALLLIISVGATVLSVWALRAEAQTRENLFESQLSEARAITLSRRPGQRFASLAILDQAGQLARTLKLPKEKLHELRDATLAALARPDFYPDRSWSGFPKGSLFVDIDDSMEVYAQSNRDGRCTVRRIADNVEILAIEGTHANGLECWPFLSRDGRFVAVRQTDGRLQLWRIDREQPEKLLTVEHVTWVNFHPTRPQVAIAGHDGAIAVYDLDSRRGIHFPPDELSRDVTIALHPTEPLLAVASYHARVVKIRDSRTGEIIKSLPLPTWTGFDVAWHPRGHTLAVSSGGTISLFDRSTFACRLTFGQTGGGDRIFFNHAGDRLATYGWNSAVQLYDVATGQLVFEVPHTRPIFALRFDHDDRHLAGYIDGERIGIWKLGDGREFRTLVCRTLPRDAVYQGATISPDSRVLAVLTTHGVGFWELDSGKELGFLPLKEARFAHFEPASRSAILIGDATSTFRWPIRAERSSWRIGPPQALPLPAGSVLDQSRDGRIVVTACRAVSSFQPWAGAWLLRDDQPGAPMHLAPDMDLWSAAISPDGRWLVTGQDASGVIQLWDAATGEFKRTLMENGASPRFSTDGRWLAVGGRDGRLFRVETWEEGPRLANTGRFAPDGSMLAVWTDTAAVRLVETATGRELARLEDPELERAREILFSQDGTRLVTVHSQKGIHIWDLHLLRTELAQRGHDWNAPHPKPPLPSGELLRVQCVPADYHRLRDQQEEKNYDLAVRAAPAIAQRWYFRACYREQAGLHAQAQADLRKALELRPTSAFLLNALARLLCTGPETIRAPQEAVKLAEQAVALQPGEWSFRTTMGIALYRAGRWSEAVSALQTSLKGGAGQGDGFNLYFLAMAWHRLGASAEAQNLFSQATAWHRAQSNLSAEQTRELGAFYTEAAALLGVPPKFLPPATP